MKHIPPSDTFAFISSYVCKVLLFDNALFDWKICYKQNTGYSMYVTYHATTQVIKSRAHWPVWMFALILEHFILVYTSVQRFRVSMGYYFYLKSMNTELIYNVFYHKSSATVFNIDNKCLLSIKTAH